MPLFFLGLLLGLIVFSIAFYRARRANADLEERTRLVQQEKQTIVNFMRNMVEALGEDLSKVELYQRIVHASIVSTGAMSACVFERTEKGTLKGVSVEGLFPPHRALSESLKVKLTTRAKYIEKVLKAEEFPIGEGVVGEVAKNRKGVLIEDCTQDSRIVKHDDPALEIRTVICVPIMFQDHVIGVLTICNSADGLPFTETDFSLVQALADQSGMAIHNNEFVKLQVEKKQIDVDLELAHSIQMMLLPEKLPEVVGADIDVRYESSQMVGGDLYDVIPFGENLMGIAVADVSGKGIPASMIMAICRTNLRHFARPDECPAETLRRLNTAMAGEMRPGMYITMVYAVFDLASNTVTFARAGHEKPLICREGVEGKSSSVEFLGSGGMPVGLVDADLFDEMIEPRTVEFRKGDVFVLYTDGITESMNSEGKEFTGIRLAERVKSLRKRPTKELNDGVLENLERFTGGDRSGADDLTLLTVKHV